mgnify:CR=1 FL=1|jgi:hypothetical protein
MPTAQSQVPAGTRAQRRVWPVSWRRGVVSAFRVHVSVRAQSCTAPKALNDVRIDVPFTAMDGKKWEARKLQRQMKAMGVGGKLYDRDSLNDMMDEEGMGDMGDDLGGMGEGDEGFDFETPIDNETPMPEVSDPLVALADAVSVPPRLNLVHSTCTTLQTPLHSTTTRTFCGRAPSHDAQRRPTAAWGPQWGVTDSGTRWDGVLTSVDLQGTAQALAKTAETLADSVVDTIRQVRVPDPPQRGACAAGFVRHESARSGFSTLL